MQNHANYDAYLSYATYYIRGTLQIPVIFLDEVHFDASKVIPKEGWTAMYQWTKAHTLDECEIRAEMETGEEDDEAKADAETSALDRDFGGSPLLEEVGCSVCHLPNGHIKLVACTESGTNAGCNISFMQCQQMGGKHIGTFHTHPIGTPLPSIPDLNCTHDKHEPVFAIGGRIGGDVVIRVFVIESFSALKHHLDMEGTRSMSRLFGGGPSHNPDRIGYIRFWREDPGPTPEEAIEIIETTEGDDPESFWEDHDGMELRKAIVDELNTGTFPSEWFEMFEQDGREGEWDALDVLPPDIEEEQDAVELEKLKAFCQVYERRFKQRKECPLSEYF